jgi:hypothetical protein
MVTHQETLSKSTPKTPPFPRTKPHTQTEQQETKLPLKKTLYPYIEAAQTKPLFEA